MMRETEVQIGNPSLYFMTVRAQDPMKPITNKLLLLAVVMGCAVMVRNLRNNDAVAAQLHKPVTAQRLYTGSDGQTHIDNVPFELKPTADGTETSDEIQITHMRIVRWPPGHVNDWHTASNVDGRQYVITLSGRAENEVVGGSKTLLEPGSIVLGEDMTGKGHITRTVGTED